MSIAIARERLNPLEMGTLVVGFLITGIAIAVTTVSYALNMTFQYQWLVWVITAAFGAVALITLAWPLAVTLFSVTALRGIRPRASAALSGVMTGMIVFMAVGNPLFGFPWAGCV